MLIKEIAEQQAAGEDEHESTPGQNELEKERMNAF